MKLQNYNLKQNENEISWLSNFFAARKSWNKPQAVVLARRPFKADHKFFIDVIKKQWIGFQNGTS